jgi:predicted N-acetyltransferase YhbS
MTLAIVDLFTQPGHVSTVAGWIHNEFWLDKDIHTPESLEQLLRHANSDDALPLSLLAISDGEPVGTVNLIENDDEERTHLRPWLAALYIDPEHRLRGIGSALVRELQQRALRMGIDTMFLGTDNTGFYARLGARIHEQVRDDFCVMQLDTFHPPGESNS